MMLGKLTVFALLFGLLLCFGCIGGGGNPTPEPTATPTPVVTATPGLECGADSDCAVMGCADQWCVPDGYTEQLACEWKDWYSCLNLTSCGCVDGACGWKDDYYFGECRHNLTALCPGYKEPDATFTRQCRANGGEPVTLPDAKGCYVNPVCSSAINCIADAGCPTGFYCPAGKCIASPKFCGGIEAIECSGVLKCFFSGSYRHATGECRKACTRNEGCDSGEVCSEGYCIKASLVGCYNDTECGFGMVCSEGDCVSAQGIQCGGENRTVCPAGFYCLTETLCREDENCMELDGTCDATAIPVGLSRLCNKVVDLPNLNVTGIAKCRGSSYYQLHRQNSKMAYVDEHGEVVRECGASAPPRDPICGGMDRECAAGGVVSCSLLEDQRFIHCPPPYSSSSDCPAIIEPVCALAKVGSTPALRSPEWKEFGNGCRACAGSTPTSIIEGFWLGECP